MRFDKETYLLVQTILMDPDLNEEERIQKAEEVSRQLAIEKVEANRMPNFNLDWSEVDKAIEDAKKVEDPERVRAIRELEEAGIDVSEISPYSVKTE